MLHKIHVFVKEHKIFKRYGLLEGILVSKPWEYFWIYLLMLFCSRNRVEHLFPHITKIIINFEYIIGMKTPEKNSADKNYYYQREK